MILREYQSLAGLTTFKVGGLARYVAVCESKEDVQEAIAFAGVISSRLEYSVAVVTCLLETKTILE